MCSTGFVAADTAFTLCVHCFRDYDTAPLVFPLPPLAQTLPSNSAFRLAARRSALLRQAVAAGWGVAACFVWSQVFVVARVLWMCFQDDESV